MASSFFSTFAPSSSLFRWHALRTTGCVHIETLLDQLLLYPYLTRHRQVSQLQAKARLREEAESQGKHFNLLAYHFSHQRGCVRTLAFTAVTSVAQAYSAALLEAHFIIPYYNRLERLGVDASKRIAEMAEVLSHQQLPTRILAASIKSPVEAVSALLSGAHDITAAPGVLLEMVSDPQTDAAVEKFTQDWQKVNKQ